MKQILLFLLNISLLSFTTSTDDFFLSFSYGISCPDLNDRFRKKICRYFAAFQLLAVLAGFIVTDILEFVYHPFVNIVPYVLLVFLLLLGIKLLGEGIYFRNHELKRHLELTDKSILLHAATTSIDAFSVGITLAGKPVWEVLILSLLISGMTYLRCSSGIKFGKKLKIKLPFEEGILSGIIIIALAFEIYFLRLF